MHQIRLCNLFKVPKQVFQYYLRWKFLNVHPQWIEHTTHKDTQKGPASKRKTVQPSKDVIPKDLLDGGFKHFWFSPPLGEMIQFDYCNIFQMSWNHQLVLHCFGHLQLCVSVLISCCGFVIWTPFHLQVFCLQSAVSSGYQCFNGDPMKLDPSTHHPDGLPW